jgi:hypothetical protein
VLWGTDSIWYGSPQPQIEAFRTFTISDEFQDRFGYPALTDRVRRMVLGGNAAALYGIDEPVRTTCAVSEDELATLRAALPPPRAYGPRTVSAALAHMRAHAIVPT